MKKLILISLGMILIMSLFATMAYAQSTTIDTRKEAYCKNDPDRNIGYCTKLRTGGVSCTPSNARNKDCFDVGH